MLDGERPDRWPRDLDAELEALIAELQQLLTCWETRMLKEAAATGSEVHELHAELGHLRAAVACLRAVAARGRVN